MENMTPTTEPTNKERALLAMDLIHRTLMHHVFWFKEVEHQLGFEEALSVLEEAYEKSRQNQLTRLGKTLGFSLEDGIPKPLLDLSEEQLDKLIEVLGINWLAGDGIWFQAVESRFGMNDAKRANDTCWAWFSPFEAWSVKRLLGLGESPGLEGLKKALGYRLYAQINTQSIAEETENSFVFRMEACRVQAARVAKGLEDYPCKSAGLVEYGRFARAIDSRIKTECIGCPPDDHPAEWFCAWKFTIEGGLE